MGPFLCHTTNILNCCFYCIVQWYKPPFLRFSNSLISHRHMKYLWNPSLTDLFFSVFFKPFLVRFSFLDFLWIDIIIAPGFLFVNTIFDFYLY